MFLYLSSGIVLTLSISVIKHNFLINGLASLAILIVIVVGTFFLVSRSVIVITVVTVISQLIWFLINEIVLQKKLNILSYRNTIFIFLAMILFYLVYFINNDIIAMFSYLILIISLSLITYLKEVKLLYRYFKRKKE